ncbi:hypothetical protein ABT56_20180 [Photobacterium aquae]|uniref:Uncharacterized protein n=1 Tax=Photobacterium aquae TaxID=1195763 RepID=A0A0J1GV61_9GAMM|nr:hypothetical protein ABT56_20180 [Photobacterium aquae]
MGILRTKKKIMHTFVVERYKQRMCEQKNKPTYLKVTIIYQFRVMFIFTVLVEYTAHSLYVNSTHIFHMVYCEVT